MADTEVVRLKCSVTEADHTLGPDTAPVTLVEYGDFECPHCGEVFSVIKQVHKLVAENLRFVFRHFPVAKAHPHAFRAAEAAEAANAQGKFWAMHDELFTHQGSLGDEHLTRYARRIGLNVEQFKTDLLGN